MFKDIIKLPEPKWWEQLLIAMNDYVNKSYILSKYVPITADIFVFSYPIYLAGLYLYGINKKDIDYKNAALYIFFSWFGSIVTNLIIQIFVDKQRPEQLVLSASKLILEHVPDKPFPSDHAALSSAIATASIIWWIKYKQKNYIYFGTILWVFSLIMSISRIAAWVHWPTDIIVWSLVWILIPLLLIKQNILTFLKQNIFSHIIKLEKFLMNKLFKIEQ